MNTFSIYSKFCVCTRAPPTHKHVRTKRHNIPQAAATFLILWRFFFWDHSRQTVLCRVRNRFFVCALSTRIKSSLEWCARSYVHASSKQEDTQTHRRHRPWQKRQWCIRCSCYFGCRCCLSANVRSDKELRLINFSLPSPHSTNKSRALSFVCLLAARSLKNDTREEKKTKNFCVVHSLLCFCFGIHAPRSTSSNAFRRQTIQPFSSHACEWRSHTLPHRINKHGILSFHSSHTELDWLFARSLDAGTLIRHTRTRTDTHIVVCGHFVVQQHPFRGRAFIKLFDSVDESKAQNDPTTKWE